MALAQQRHHESLEHLATTNDDFLDVADYVINYRLNFVSLSSEISPGFGIFGQSGECSLDNLA